MAFAQQAIAESPFARAETEALLLHGPWPQPWRPDPSNRVSGNAEAARLGQRLFFDARLSPSGRVACSSCHRPERSWTDGRAQAKGLALSRRNTPGLLDVRLNRWLGWGGAGDSLWAQSIRPMLDPREMGSSAAHVMQLIARSPDVAALYAAAFGRPIALVEAEAALVDAGKALAAFQETLASPRTPFDALRDALAGGDPNAAARFPAKARRGAALFVGSAGCSRCHSGPTFSDNLFHRIDRTRRIGDEGRYRDAVSLSTSPHSLVGRFNDDPDRRVAWRAEQVRQPRSALGAFRTPPLRNVERTSPYLHDGSAPSLAAAIRAHEAGRRLDKAQADDLVAFLRTLSTP